MDSKSDQDTRVALVAGATRGAGRAIAELARAGLFVYASGRSSRGLRAVGDEPPRDAGRWAGTIISARQLADDYGVTDTDGSKPDCWGYLAAYGWERDDGEGIDTFR